MEITLVQARVFWIYALNMLLGIAIIQMGSIPNTIFGIVIKTALTLFGMIYSFKSSLGILMTVTPITYGKYTRLIVDKKLLKLIENERKIKGE